MPQMGGKAVAEHILELYPSIKVLFMSSYTEHATLKNSRIDAGSAFSSEAIYARRCWRGSTQCARSGQAINPAEPQAVDLLGGGTSAGPTSEDDGVYPIARATALTAKTRSSAALYRAIADGEPQRNWPRCIAAWPAPKISTPSFGKRSCARPARASPPARLAGARAR